jgi:excisionase family DNA binding protein
MPRPALEKLSRDHFTVPQICHKLGVGLQKVYGWISDGDLRAVNLSRGNDKPRYMVSLKDLEAFLEKRQTVEASHE